MALTEEKIIDQITVTETGHILFREATIIKKDDKEVAKTYHRTSLNPGQDLIGIPANVAAIANVVWTSEVVLNYQNSINNNSGNG